jgi:hypothetical protein
MRTSASLPVLTALRERIQRLEGGTARSRTVLPFGIQAIDRHLPEGGLALGALHEVAGGGNGAIDGAAAALFTAGIGSGTLVVYSAKEGPAAVDGDGVNSPFALAFAARLKKPGREMQRMFDDVRDDDG